MIDRESSRRGFLRTAIAGTAAALAGAALSGEGKDTPRIIDTHTHFYDPSRPQGVPWPPKSDKVLYRTVLPKEYKAMVQPLGVVGTVVVEASAWPDDNQWVLDLAANEPFIVGIVGRIDARQETFKDQLKRYSANPLYRGIRINEATVTANMESKDFIENLKRLADADMELDVVDHPRLAISTERVSAQIPNLRIVIDHLPFDPLPDAAKQAEIETAMKKMAERPNVFVKVSNVLRRPAKSEKAITDVEHYRAQLDAIWGLFGADRVIYGSNWPVSDLVAPYSDVLQIVREYLSKKDPEVVEKYFFKNSKTAYRWIDRK